MAQIVWEQLQTPALTLSLPVSSPSDRGLVFTVTPDAPSPPEPPGPVVLSRSLTVIHLLMSLLSGSTSPNPRAAGTCRALPPLCPQRGRSLRVPSASFCVGAQEAAAADRGPSQANGMLQGPYRILRGIGIATVDYIVLH